MSVSLVHSSRDNVICPHQRLLPTGSISLVSVVVLKNLCQRSKPVSTEADYENSLEYLREIRKLPISERNRMFMWEGVE